MAFRTNKTPVLQTKSASGSVVTFNTALAMPLVNGEFTIQAYQEGSGVPAPDNVRNIVPFSAVNITRCGNNFINGEYWAQQLAANGATIDTVNKTVSYDGRIANRVGTFFKNFKPNTRYFLMFKLVASSAGTPNIIWHYTDGTKETIYGINGQFISRGSNANKSVDFIAFEWASGTTELDYENFGLFDYASIDMYEPYNGNVYTKSLGEVIYGCSYNSVSGVKSKTWIGVLIKNLSWSYNSASAYFVTTPSDRKIGLTNVLCEVLKYDGSSTALMPNYSIKGDATDRRIFVKDTNATTENELIADIGDYVLMYELDSTIETNIGSTSIETLIGDNNIFCDTGDTCLTYKDLDIAKRGNFREVFKLPS